MICIPLMRELPQASAFRNRGKLECVQYEKTQQKNPLHRNGQIPASHTLGDDDHLELREQNPEPQVIQNPNSNHES